MIVQSTFMSGNVAGAARALPAVNPATAQAAAHSQARAPCLSFARASLIGNVASGGSTFMGALPGQGSGGGIYIDPAATVLLNGSTFLIGNRATTQGNQIFGTPAG